MRDLAPAFRIMDEVAELRGRLQAALHRMYPEDEARARALIVELDRTTLVWTYVIEMARLLRGRENE